MPRFRLLVLLAIPTLALFALARWTEPSRPARSPESADTLLARLGDRRFRHAAMIDQIVYRPDGKAVAATGRNRPEVVEWDASSGRVLHQYTDPESPTRSVHILAYTPDARRLITRVADRVVTFDTATGAVMSRIDFSNVIRVAPDGTSVIGRSPSRRLTLWDVETGQVKREYPTDVHEDVRYSPDGRWVAAALASDAVREEPGTGRVTYRGRAWVGPVGGTGHVLNLGEWTVGGIGGYYFTVHFAWVKPDRVLLASGTHMATFDPATGERKVVVPPPKDGIRQMWVSDGRMFIQYFGDLRAFEYDPDTLAPVPGGMRMDEPEPPALSPDGRIVARGQGNRVHLHNVATGRVLPLDGEWALDSAPFAIRFSADGRRMITTGYGGAHTFDLGVDPPRVLVRLGDGRNSEGSLLSPDGRWG